MAGGEENRLFNTGKSASYTETRDGFNSFEAKIGAHFEISSRASSPKRGDS